MVASHRRTRIRTQSAADTGFDERKSVRLRLLGAFDPVPAIVTYGYTTWARPRSGHLA
jgi:hypothetical protein